MTIEGWVAVSPLGLVLGTFRQNEDEAKDAARRVLRLLGGPHLVAGFCLAKATLVVHDEAGPSGERAEAETN
jgi:hypothetical protein